MRSKHLLAILVALSLVVFCATAAMAAPRHSGHSGPFYSRSDRSPAASVYLFPQDMDTFNGMFRFNPWGLLSYRLWGQDFRFSFRGFNLDRRTQYTLIYYPDPDSDAEMIQLGNGRTNRRGQLRIKARLNICSLPSTMDPNYFYGARIMLVPSDKVMSDVGMLETPGSEENLINYHPIRFVDTDGCPSDEDETVADGPGEEDQESEGGSDGDTEEPPPPGDHPGDSGFLY